MVIVVCERMVCARCQPWKTSICERAFVKYDGGKVIPAAGPDPGLVVRQDITHCFIRQLTSAAKPPLTLATVALRKALVLRVTDG